MKNNVKISFNQGCLLDLSSIYTQTLSFVLQIEKRRSRRMYYIKCIHHIYVIYLTSVYHQQT